MPTLPTLLAFSLAALVLLIIPGPSVLYIVTRSVTQGRRAGIVSMLGVHVGSIVHMAAAILGVSAVLASSATAFTIVKYLGAAYLVWLGIQQFRARDVDPTIARDPAPRRRLFAQGVVVNVLNPKTAIFFLAFLPQFADPERGPVPVQLAVLGGLFILLGILSDGAYALAAGFLARPLQTVRFRRRLRYGSGAVYLGLGITAALSQSRTG